MEAVVEAGILDSLEDIGYTGPLLNPETFTKAINGGPKSTEYTRFVHEMAEELKLLNSMEETVNPSQGPDDASSFILELSSFLKELGCQYDSLTTGHLSSRLQSRLDRLVLLEYLLSEVMAARMNIVKNPHLFNRSLDVQIEESETAEDLKNIMIALKLDKPPPDITTELLFAKIENKFRENIQREGPDYVGRALYNKALSEKEWKELEITYKSLYEEYKMRRGMLITRMDCTIQSFEWSGKGGQKREEIQAIYQPLRAKLKVAPDVKLSDFLAARDTLLTLRKTSDAAVRVNTKSKVNQVLIGKVPDRGGRPSEQEAPASDMPTWQNKRSQGDGGQRGGFGRGRGGMGGGSRVQGGWNPGRGGGESRGGNRNQNYQDHNHQDTRNFNDNSQRQQQGNYHDNRNYQSYQDSPGSVYQNYLQAQGYQNAPQQNYQNQGFQSQGQQGYHGQNYTNQNSGFAPQGYQGKGHYQNEHDDRTESYENRGYSRGRGRSNYNRGGRR